MDKRRIHQRRFDADFGAAEHHKRIPKSDLFEQFHRVFIIDTKLRVFLDELLFAGQQIHRNEIGREHLPLFIRLSADHLFQHNLLQIQLGSVLPVHREFEQRERFHPEKQPAGLLDRRLLRAQQTRQQSEQRQLRHAQRNSLERLHHDSRGKLCRRRVSLEKVHRRTLQLHRTKNQPPPLHEQLLHNRHQKVPQQSNPAPPVHQLQLRKQVQPQLRKNLPLQTRKIQKLAHRRLHHPLHQTKHILLQQQSQRTQRNQRHPQSRRLHRTKVPTTQIPRRNQHQIVWRILGHPRRQPHQQTQPHQTLHHRQQTQQVPQRNQRPLGKRPQKQKNRPRKPINRAIVRLFPPRNPAQQKAQRRNHQKNQRRAALRIPQNRRRQIRHQQPGHFVGKPRLRDVLPDERERRVQHNPDLEQHRAPVGFFEAGPNRKQHRNADAEHLRQGPRENAEQPAQAVPQQTHLAQGQLPRPRQKADLPPPQNQNRVPHSAQLPLLHLQRRRLLQHLHHQGQVREQRHQKRLRLLRPHQGRLHRRQHLQLRHQPRPLHGPPQKIRHQHERTSQIRKQPRPNRTQRKVRRVRGGTQKSHLGHARHHLPQKRQPKKQGGRHQRTHQKIQNQRIHARHLQNQVQRRRNSRILLPIHRSRQQTRQRRPKRIPPKLHQTHPLQPRQFKLRSNRPRRQTKRKKFGTNQPIINHQQRKRRQRKPQRKPNQKNRNQKEKKKKAKKKSKKKKNPAKKTPKPKRK